MIRQKHTGDIYLISLDTFMIMTIVGFIIGMILMVVNPLLNPTDKRAIISYEQYTLTDRYAFEECIREEFPYVNFISGDEISTDEDTGADIVYEIESDDKVVISLTSIDSGQLSTEAFLLNIVSKLPCFNYYLTDPKPIE